MVSYRIVLEYSNKSNDISPPGMWDWHDLIASDLDEAVTLVEVEKIDTPAAHLEDFAEWSD